MLRDPHRLLEPGALSDADVDRLLEPISFADVRTAHARLLSLCPSDAHRQALNPSMPMLLTALQDAATPDTSLLNLERLMQAVPDSLQLLQFLAENPRAVEMLVRLFVQSQFLTEIVLRNPKYIERLTEHRRLAEFLSRDDFRDNALQRMAPEPGLPEKLSALRRYQQWELLRIGACDSFGLFDLKTVTIQLSLLADGIAQSALQTLSETLQVDVSQFAVIAFGKLGGEELNYSSDIDLVFVCEDHANRFWDLGQRLIRALMDSTGDGFLYRVDMRLRPWGASGPLVTTIDGYADYLKRQAALWEKQALLKARPIAGSMATGQRFLGAVEPFVFGVPAIEVRDNIRSLRSRAESAQKRDGRSTTDIKSGRGSIRDVEFVTQYLQLRYGGDNDSIRSLNTLDGLIRLADADLIQANEYRQLSTGYVLLRTIEHSLQLMHYRQTHTLPDDAREQAWLARRLDFPDAASFLNSVERHTNQIRAVYRQYIEETRPPAERPIADAPALPQHTAAMEPSYARVFTPEEIDRHAILLSRLGPENPVEVQALPAPGGRVQLTVCGFDQTGDLAMICGLLFAHGFNVVNGNVFTSAAVQEARQTATEGASSETQRPNFVNVFQLTSETPPDPDIWRDYRRDLTRLMQLASAGRPRDAQGRLARRTARVLRDTPASATPSLRPIDIVIDNSASDRFTVLNISAADSPGFLYELTNALSLGGYDIHRMTVTTIGERAMDTLYISAPGGGRVDDEQAQKRLRAAVVLVKHFTHLLPQSSNPENALLHFRQLLEQSFEQTDWVDELAALGRSEVLQALARMLGVSDFLWEDFLRLQHDNLFPVLSDVESLTTRKPRQQLCSELQNALAATESEEEQLVILNEFKDRETFRVDMRHIAGHIAEFGEFSNELTEIVDVVIESAIDWSRRNLERKYGRLLSNDGESARLSVLALGKAGGCELGFASDIELLFIYSGSGRSDGDRSISEGSYFVKLVERFAKTIRARRKGIFELDLRLRPYGSAGPLAVSLTAFRDYFSLDGAAWPYERQGLLKLRHVAGDKELGQEVLQLRDSILFTGKPFDVTSMRAMRERQVRQQVETASFNAKLSPGGLVDCEYLVQALQMMHGHRHKELRGTSTLGTLDALHDLELISPDDFGTTRQSYIFLRRLIDALRMVRGDASDLTVPEPDTDEFEFLCRRLGYGHELSRFQSDLDATISSVISLGRLIDP